VNVSVVDTQTGALNARCSSTLDTIINYQTYEVLCCPVKFNGVVCGIIKACRGLLSGITGNVTPFDEQDESMISCISCSVGFAIKCLPSYDRGASSRSIANATPNNINRESFDEVSNWIVNSAYAHFKADRVSVFLQNATTGDLECVISPDANGITIPAKSGIAGHVFTSSMVANVSDVGQDSRFFSIVDEKTKFKTLNILCAPLVNSIGRTLGVIQVINKSDPAGFTVEDEFKISEIAKQLATVIQAKLDVQNIAKERSMLSSLAAVIYQILSAHTLPEMLSAAKVSLAYLIQADYVDVFELDYSNGSNVCMKKLTSDQLPAVARGSGKFAVSSITASRSQSPRASFDELINIPKEILLCIRKGEMMMTDQKHDFIPGVNLNVACIYPLGSKVFAGNPCKHVLVVGRMQNSQTFSFSDKQALDVFVELLGNSMANMQAMKEQESHARKSKWELNMVIKALRLLHNHVMLLDSSGNISAYNKAIAEVCTSEKQINCHYSLWFNADQSVLLEDIASVYATGKGVHKDCVLIKNASHANGLFLSYQICPVRLGIDMTTENLEDVDPSDIGSVILIIHAHSNDEEGVKKLRQVLAAKASSGCETLADTSTVTGTMNAVAQAICEIGGRFELDHDEQTAVNAVAANLMKVSRNMRISMVGAGASTIQLPSFDSLVLVSDDAKAIPDLFTWEFDVNLYPNKSTLRGVLGRLFDSMFNLSEIQVNSKTLASFFREAEKHYHDNPFHNFYHITCVTHFCYMLINATNGKELLNNNMYYLFAIMASAVVHDIDHPGNSNLYEINSKSELALLYNDNSVLENHHCSMAFRIMRYHNADILGELPSAAFKDVKKTMVSCILATDMSVHFDLIDSIKKKIQDGWDLTDARDIFFYCRIMLHAADLSNPVRPFHLSKLWASRISEEFNRQVELEKAQNLPVLGFMITPDEKTLCKNEIGFASFVVAPMWRNLELLFPPFKHLVDQLNKNLDSWKELLDVMNEGEKKSERATDAV
jgi:hypothetical protein